MFWFMFCSFSRWQNHVVPQKVKPARHWPLPICKPCYFNCSLEGQVPCHVLAVDNVCHDLLAKLNFKRCEGQLLGVCEMCTSIRKFMAVAVCVGMQCHQEVRIIRALQLALVMKCVLQLPPVCRQHCAKIFQTICEKLRQNLASAMFVAMASIALASLDRAR